MMMMMMVDDDDDDNNNGRFLYSAFHNVPMRFTISGGLFRAAFCFNAQWQQLTIMRDNER
jgi:hypothetical protein